ncbi:hypothetical protein [Psychrobacillus psychrotolerans]|uniref:hypothetical protein n=1 Tax=Psychrobacillus psychrotolerans TaxID=126156 RepID=UPI003B01044B
MKKYNIQLLINSPTTFSYWKGVESDKAPKKINDGVIQIGEVYYNAINVKEIIVIENH